MMFISAASVGRGSAALSGSLVALTARASRSGRRATILAAASTLMVNGILQRMTSLVNDWPGQGHVLTYVHAFSRRCFLKCQWLPYPHVCSFRWHNLVKHN